MIRARYLSTAPFSFRREQATTKMAQTYPCPTPYAAKVALIVGAIRAGLNPAAFTEEVRSMDITPHPWGEGVVNTHLLRHYQPPDHDESSYGPGELQKTVAHREFVYFDGGVDLYFEAEHRETLRPALPCVNCFGKQGSFFTLMDVSEEALPEPLLHFDGSDMKDSAEWEAESGAQVSRIGGSNSTPREDVKMGVRMHMAGAGANHLHLKFDGSENGGENA
jgi:hypothetical protein